MKRCPAAALLSLALASPPFAALGADVKPPETIDLKASCVTATCHAELKKKKQLHGPVADDECIECHVPKDNQHKFTYPAEGKKLCETCHDPFEKERAVHEPVTEDCITCHDPHGAPERGLLVMNRVELCEACHGKEVAQTRSPHAHKNGLDGKACNLCHEAHTSPVAKLLKAKPFDLCLSCHDKETKAGERTIPAMKTEIAGKVVHGPVEDKDCLACHAPHGSKYVAMAKEEYPAAFYAPFGPKTYALCFSCHDEAMLAKERTDEDTEFRNGTTNLHYRHVHKDVKGRSCRACHAVHASAQPALIRTSVPFGRGGWAIRIRFTRTDAGGTCASGCHLPRTYSRETPVEY